ncbi:TraR/DksA family transcriptional regulator [Polaribacter aestuariivivens]|uniref:TraR/DksA family transcriptional regulator n=1 Tax=Polaribacter aestuariivivens TaxID=2304626 RepID=UPI003F495DF3
MSDKLQYSPEKLSKFKTIIKEELKKVEDELSKFETNLKEQKQRLANANVDFNQTSKHSQQQAKNKQLKQRLEEKTKELKSALQRIENKVYGICERTGLLIREKRLLAKPTARFDILPKQD